MSMKSPYPYKFPLTVSLSWTYFLGILLICLTNGLAHGKAGSTPRKSQSVFRKVSSVLQSLTGSVTDENGSGLPGVSILIKGTQRGTTTDTKGQYQLELPNGSVTLVFSFVGYVSQEKEVSGSQSILNVSLSPDTQTLDEMIVIGYGSVKKSDLTGSVASIKVGEVQHFPAVSGRCWRRHRPGAGGTRPGRAGDADLGHARRYRLDPDSGFQFPTGWQRAALCH